MHVAAVMGVSEHLLPELKVLQKTLADKAEAYRDIVKIGRTHLQDATPLTLGQKFPGGRQCYLTVCGILRRPFLTCVN